MAQVARAEVGNRIGEVKDKRSRKNLAVTDSGLAHLRQKQKSPSTIADFSSSISEMYLGLRRGDFGSSQSTRATWPKKASVVPMSQCRLTNFSLTINSLLSRPIPQSDGYALSERNSQTHPSWPSPVAHRVEPMSPIAGSGACGWTIVDLHGNLRRQGQDDTPTHCRCVPDQRLGFPVPP
jgi:hypothetical protein